MHRSALLLALACALTGPAPAVAADLQLAPSILDVATRPGARIPGVALINHSGQALIVRADAVPLGQGLDGMPEFETSARAIAAGRRLVDLDQQVFEVPAHSTLCVDPRINPHTSRRAGAYAALVFTAEAAPHRAVRSGATIVPRLRLAAPLLMRLPGEVHLRGGVEAVRPLQGEGRTLDFATRLDNTGNLHRRIPATLSITDARGKVRLTRELQPTMVIPGARRELTTHVTTLLGAGRYRATVSSRFGGRRTTVTTPFELVAANRLPTPKLVLGSIRAHDATPGHSFDLSFHAANVGTAAYRGPISVAITPVHGGRTVRVADNSRALTSGADETRTVRVPGLRAGRYRVEVRAESGGFELAHARDEIEVRDSGLDSAAMWRWLQAHLVEALLSIVTLLALGTTAVASRRARRATA